MQLLTVPFHCTYSSLVTGCHAVSSTNLQHGHSWLKYRSLEHATLNYALSLNQLSLCPCVSSCVVCRIAMTTS